MSIRQPAADRSGDTSINHGTAYGYDKRGCRCSECTDANRQQRAEAKDKRAKRVAEIPHGVIGYVNWRCRCPVCFEDNRVYQLKYRPNNEALNKKRNDKSLDSAIHSGQQWTGPEIDLALRDDLTAPTVAKMIGRTVYAVINMRHRARYDVKIQRVIGPQN